MAAHYIHVEQGGHFGLREIRDADLQTGLVSLSDFLRLHISDLEVRPAARAV